MKDLWNHLEIDKHGKNQNWVRLLKSSPNLHKTPEKWSKRLGKYISDAVLNILTNLQWAWKWVNDFFDMQILLLPYNLSKKATEEYALQKEGKTQDTADHSLRVKQPRNSFINEVLLEHNYAFSS